MDTVNIAEMPILIDAIEQLIYVIVFCSSMILGGILALGTRWF